MASNFLPFIWAAALFIPLEWLYKKEALRLHPINSSNWFLYLDIRSSTLLSDPIGGEAHIVIHAQFEY